MHLRIMSDVHLEFAPFTNMAKLPTDKDGVLILAGDICPYHSLRHTLVSFLRMVSAQFGKVIYILGNHEYYGHGSLLDGHKKIRELIRKEKLKNVFLLQNQTKIIEQVAFIGATLWTDFDKGNSLSMFNAQRGIADYGEIFYHKPNGYFRRIVPGDTYALHLRSRRYVFEAVKKQKALGRKTVLVLHHGVSSLSVHERYRGQSLNSAFVSDLSSEILDVGSDLIIHGHVHDSFDYVLGSTRVVVNPRGYPRENKGWNESLVVEI